MKFDDILTNDDLLDAIYDMHFDECTPIQEKSIPVALEGRDLLAIAQTGTGKTAAYLLPVLEQLVNENYPTDRVNCIIMAPTRELARQIDEQLQGFSYYVPVTSMPVYGGTDGITYEKQRQSLKSGADIIIATPGRLLSHINMGYVNLSRVSFFILDEADRMLDMGFYDDIMTIASHLPKERQTMLFSATMPDKIRQLANNILVNPVDVRIAVSKPADKIDQGVFLCYEPQKIPLLVDMFSKETPKKVVIFGSSKQKVKELARNLHKKGIAVAEIHSDLEQDRRDEVMLKFRAGHVSVLVATDIISRGIDIDDIDTIINFDVPRSPEDYVHRIGRTARAEKEGKAITLVSERDFPKLSRIQRLIGKEIERLPLPEFLGEGPLFTVSQKQKSRHKNKNRRKDSTGGHKRGFSHKNHRNRNQQGSLRRSSED
ncbi:MAG: DEAD/DEAH box helicase [Muribaculaceae bacterium]|nr:DEAD/DEAH box helicase [Muribaculaceae bacterium]